VSLSNLPPVRRFYFGRIGRLDHSDEPAANVSRL
jgi:hypothetical protein